jgi:hypothetical protein
LFISVYYVEAGVDLAAHVDDPVIVLFEDKVKTRSIIQQGQLNFDGNLFFLDTLLQSLRG